MNQFINNRYTIVAFILSILNIIFIKNEFISITIVIAEILILLNLLRLNKLPQFISWYIIFLATSIEFSVFVSNEEDISIFGFKQFRIFGIGISTLFIYISFIYTLYKFKFKIIGLRKIRGHINFIRYITIMLIIAVLIGLFNILLNDNNIQQIPNYFTNFLGQIYLSTWPFLVFYIVYVVLIKYPDGEKNISRALFAMFIATCTAPLLPAVFGVIGSYGELPYMLVSNSAMLSPFIILFYFYKEYKSPLYILLFVTGVVIPLIFFSYVNGKLILLLLILPFLLFFIYRSSMKFTLKSVVLISFLVVGIFMTFSNLSKNEGTLFNSKYKEAMGLLDFNNAKYLLLLDPSTRFRFIEFVNVIDEYKKKPIFLLTGKGFMGSIKDESIKFPFSETGGFPLDEYKAHTFYSLHEFTSFILRFGLIGIFSIIIIIIHCFRSISYNPWIIIGAYWYLIFFGYSITLSIVGVSCLSYGCYIYNYRVQQRH
jgi:hypothetical protein